MTTIRPTTTPSGPRRWLQDHLRALDATLLRLRRRPLATLLTLAMVGLTLALPTALVALGGALTAGGENLGSQALQAALFLHRSVDEPAARALEHRIAGERGVRAVRYISAAQGLKELRRESGLSGAIDHLGHNPLPATLVVQFDPSQPQAVVQQRFHALAQLPEVAQARMDPHWMTRLYALLDLLRRAALVLAVALSATVLIVLGNTVRLELESHREEMEVLALHGATRAYLMRPYLYLGALFGLAGAVLALLLVACAGLALRAPVAAVASAYQLGWHGLPGPGLGPSLLLLVIGLGLGWIAAYGAARQHLAHLSLR